MIKVHFVINASRPLSNKSKRAIELCVQSQHLECFKYFTKGPKDAVYLTKESIEKGAKMVISVGGDGTCNEVLNGIRKAGNSDVIMGIIPNGTGNDFAKMLSEFRPDKFLRLVESQTFRKIDILKVIGASISQYALNIAGGGFDGFVVNMLNSQREKLKLGGKFSYALAILRSFVLYKKPIVELHSEEFQYTGKCLLVAACNGSTFGHGLIIHPKASLNNGVFGVTLMGNVTLLDYVKYLGKLKKGIEISHPEVRYFETKKLHISAQNAPLYSQLDGEFLSNESLTVEVVPEGLRFLK